MSKVFVAIAALALAGYGLRTSWLDQWEVEQPPGVLAASAPRQVALSTPKRIQFEEYELEAVASYSVTGRVLSKKRYRFGREADLAPIDFALGWGSMSDSAVLDQLKISQGNRFYYWRCDEMPIPRKEIETESANVHFIPADETVNRQLSRLRPGTVATFDGYLVNVSATDGWRWRSSLTRTDSGNGACEVMFVNAVTPHAPSVAEK